MEDLKETFTSEYFRFLVFGLPTWALVDGTWALLSQLANNSPEGYDISAYLILALTCGNIFPLLIGYSLKNASLEVLSLSIQCILVLGFVTGILMAFFWDISVEISGKQVSLPLYILFFVIGACSSTSNVTHFTFVSTYDAKSTTALATGMGLGSMTAGLLGILQGLLLINYGFSVTVYYITLSILYVPAFCIFTYSLYYGFSHDTKGLLAGINGNTFGLHSTHQLDYEKGIDLDNALLRTESSQQPPTQNPMSADIRDDLNSPSSKGYVEDAGEYKDIVFIYENFPILALQMMNSSLGYGIVPAIISFSCGKFDHASRILLFATGLSAFIDPWFRALTAYVRITSITGLWLAGAFLVFLASLLLLCAGLPSSSPLFAGYGGIMPIILYISFNSLFGFTNTCVFRFFKESVRFHVHHAYRWSGIASQTGALLGSILAFALVVSNNL